ncbi:MAG: hypothetical protein EOO01_06300, partial [Chitinophagaceae bacterium]
MRSSTNKTLVLIIVVLVLTNIAVLGYFLWYKKADPVKTDKDRNGIAEPLEKEVGFSSDQLGQYKLLKDKQRELVRPMYEDMRHSKDSLFKLLGTNDVTDSAVISLA